MRNTKERRSWPEVGREQANFTGLRGSLGLPPIKRKPSEEANWLAFEIASQAKKQIGLRSVIASQAKNEIGLRSKKASEPRRARKRAFLACF